MSRASEIGRQLALASRLIGSDTARLDAEVLLATVIGRDRAWLLAWPERELSATQLARYCELVARRAAGEPVAYLTGQREFWSLPVAVSRDTLIPRPETETLVSRALELLDAGKPAAIADLGTGSGAIALALASERPDCRITATDIDPAALAVARHNADVLGLDNISFLHGNWCEPLHGHRFDLILSNPPYIADLDPHLRRGDVRFEPRSALASGSDGLDDIRALAADVRDLLRQGGWLLLEHGHEQQADVCDILATAGFYDITGWADDSGNPRVVQARR